MNVKRLSIMLMVLVPVAVISLSCKLPSARSGARISGDGKTPARAIVINPTLVQQKSQTLQITVNDNIRWFYANLNSGKSYNFETTGQGDPMVRIYRSSQVKRNGIVNGDSIAHDDDGGIGANSKLRFRPTSSGGYYIKIILYAGSRWRGNLKYKSN